MYILVNIPYICVNIYICIYLYILRFGIDKDMDSQELSESQLFVLESKTHQVMVKGACFQPIKMIQHIVILGMVAVNAP